MCGIAGYFSKSASCCNPETDLTNMGDAIEHRGPDSSGTWYLNERYSVGFVHRRLSILDLSEAGHQPMVSESGRYVISYNGEIYNHLELRQLIDKESGSQVAWRGHSDTEVFLACIETFGVRKALSLVVGMFAFSLWDCKHDHLILARDRLGEKPLYYGLQNDTLLFGSDLKSLKRHPRFQGEIDRGAVALLMRYGYIPAPSSIYAGFCKLMPGHYAVFKSPELPAKLECYWNIDDISDSQVSNQGAPGYSEAVERLDFLLKRSIKGQMVSDVAVGAFLSGGIDSTTIVALAQSQSKVPVKTFTVGFKEGLYNEAEHAKKVSEYLGTEHTELYLSAEHALDAIKKMSHIYTEPFADPSQIPTFIVSNMVRNHVTVGLSGDAGDEIFAGYNRYILTNRYWGKLSRVPYLLRLFIAKGISKIPPSLLNTIFTHVQKILPVRYQQTNIGEKLHKASVALKAKTPNELYRFIVSRWQNPEDIVIGVDYQQTVVDHTLSEEENITKEMARLDLATYLPDDILCKVDRSSMFASIESRAPFLDYRVVEFAWGLPLEYKIKNGVGKSVLRDVLYKYIPKELVDRPKMGFGVPISDWLRGPLKDWAEDLLDEDRLLSEGFFRPTLIRKMWLEHQQGVQNWQYQLWPVLMFQFWLENER